jgi:6-phospho-3-hexuloisomerase
MNRICQTILKEISAALSGIHESATQKFLCILSKAKRVYITGVGRSGLVVKAFGQRLMHLGFQVHLADEITAPGIAKKDVLVACSGTGTTKLTLYMARKAAGIGAKVVALTARPASPLAKTSELTILIPVPLEYGHRSHGIVSHQPARSLFEQTLLLYLDSIIMALIDRLKIAQTRIERRHANLE